MLVDENQQVVLTKFRFGFRKLPLPKLLAKVILVSIVYFLNRSISITKNRQQVEDCQLCPSKRKSILSLWWEVTLKIEKMKNRMVSMPGLTARMIKHTDACFLKKTLTPLLVCMKPDTKAVYRYLSVHPGKTVQVFKRDSF